MKLQYIIVPVVCSIISSCNSQRVCDKTPTGVSGPRNKNDAGRYFVEIPGHPNNYIPNRRYNISLKARARKSFRHFVLTIEPVNNNKFDYDVGRLDLGHGSESELLAIFSPHCRDTVIESSVVPKSEVLVFWTAPPKDSGCVEIKAAVVESKENWFSDDSWLNKVLCEETAADENVPPKILKQCCACQEAKYEVAFEGKWTRNTHPKNFPSDQWNTGFSEVIGASHQLHHSFWNYEDYPGEGLKMLAQHGDTKTLESELKNNSEHIRTIIKARGLQYPNTIKSTYAVFRVDNKNHLVSLVSKIIPSPDWIVGVANFELCKSDCTWEESRTFNLYPWDVGTDDGVQYTSNVPSSENQVVTKIIGSNSTDPDSPFYNENDEEIKPFAKLHLTRQRLYDKTCDVDTTTQYDNCATTDWSKWSTCSVRCGEGIMFRTRDLMDENEIENCQINLLDVKICRGKFCPEKDTTETVETITESETTEAGGSGEDDSNCPGTFWGSWSDCNATCGTGHRSRFRIKKNGFSMTEEEMQNCFKLEVEECEEKPCETKEVSDGFGNISSESQTVDRVQEVINCKVGPWGKWGDCIIDDGSSCGDGHKIRERKILRYPENGGNPCKEELVRKKRCRIPCSSEPDDECIMGSWSNWTPCSSNCGVYAVQIRTRNILYQPLGVNCEETRKETRSCRLPLACTEDGQPIYH